MVPAGKIFVSESGVRTAEDVAALQAALTPAAAVSLLVFCLLYTPCVAAVSSFKRELGSKWAFGIVVEQCVVAWIAALIIGILMRVIGFA